MGYAPDAAGPGSPSARPSGVAAMPARTAPAWPDVRHATKA